MWWMFCHERIVFLKKDEILMSFTNSCNYIVLIIMGWVYQSNQNGFGLFGMKLGTGALDITQQTRVI
jgi:hypothetical protein